jgi:hypothetical protein
MQEINYFAVLLAAVLAMAIGAFWYSPLGFGKVWLRLRGQDPARMQGMKMPLQPMLIQFVGALITAYALAIFITATGAADLHGALLIGFWAWLGFQATLLVHRVLWEGESWRLFLLNASHQLVLLLVMSGLLGLWR